MRTCSLLTCAGLLVAPTINGLSQSTIQFSASGYTVAESAGSVTLAVQRSGDTNADVSVDFFTADGTATNGLKYTAVSGTLNFGAGETNRTIVVPILDEGFVEGSKIFQAILTNATGGGVLGARTNATVLITDNDAGIQFQFAAYSVAEDAGMVWVAVVRGDDGTDAVAVDFSTTDLTAKSGLDYAGVTNTLSFAPQERLELIPVPILNNALKQPGRSFRATIANPAGATLGSQKTATITIVDNDQGFQFQSAGYSVVEDAGAVRIAVLRGTDDANSAVTVDLATANVTATNGLDYIGLTNTLSFAPGEKTKLVSVPILDDGVKEPTRIFSVTLSNPTGGAVLGSPTTATVKILDNDPGVGFELGGYSVWENAGSLTITVLRGNDMELGPITVDYSTSDGTARAGQDYQAVSGTLEFQADETVKTIAIPILRDALVTNNTSFRVALSNPTGGAALGTASATVNIQNAPEAGTFYAVAPPFDTALTIQREGDVNVLTWNGGGQLQRADSPAGPWQTLLTATNPYTVQSPVPTTFYRVTRPRPVNLYIPSSYDGTTNVPLVILLHGYGSTGVTKEDYVRFRPFAETRGFLYCYPESLADSTGTEFWNATDFCCDFEGTGVDDAGYLRSVIEEIERQFSVDRKQVYVVGHSNGGAMAYRMACQSADLIAGIASLAGPTFWNFTACIPFNPVNILHIQGTTDESFLYPGGAVTTSANGKNMPAYPGALQTVQLWAERNGATFPITDPKPSMDLDLNVPGLDTVVTRYTNAPPGGAVELWTINGGSHTPNLYSGSSTSEFAPRVIDWLFAHPKP